MSKELEFIQKKLVELDEQNGQHIMLGRRETTQVLASFRHLLECAETYLTAAYSEPARNAIIRVYDAFQL